MTRPRTGPGSTCGSPSSGPACRSVPRSCRCRATRPSATTSPPCRCTAMRPRPSPAVAVEIVGLPPAALATLPGWRPDFSATPVTQLATDLDLPAPPDGWRLQGHRLPADERTLTLHFRYVGRRHPARRGRQHGRWRQHGGAPRRPERADDDRRGPAARRRPRWPRHGADLRQRPDHRRRRAPGRAAPGDRHVRRPRRPGRRPRRSTSRSRPWPPSSCARRRSRDGLPLPAIVSPDLAADAGPGGILDLHVGAEGSIPLHVVGTADHMPTVVAANPRFVIVPLDPWLIALAEAVPTAGRPSEMWITAPSPERLAAVRSALAEPPFRFAVVTSRADEVALRAGDPLSRAIVWALIVAAVAGLILSVGGLLLGAATDLRDERGELADLEAQGVPPSSLRWHALARTAWLAGRRRHRRPPRRDRPDRRRDVGAGPHGRGRRSRSRRSRSCSRCCRSPWSSSASSAWS